VIEDARIIREMVGNKRSTRPMEGGRIEINIQGYAERSEFKFYKEKIWLNTDIRNVGARKKKYMFHKKLIWLHSNGKGKDRFAGKKEHKY
jgi:hypothetical protein